MGGLRFLLDKKIVGFRGSRPDSAWANLQRDRDELNGIASVALVWQIDLSGTSSSAHSSRRGERRGASNFRYLCPKGTGGATLAHGMGRHPGGPRACLRPQVGHAGTPGDPREPRAHLCTRGAAPDLCVLVAQLHSWCNFAVPPRFAPAARGCAGGAAVPSPPRLQPHGRGASSPLCGQERAAYPSCGGFTPWTKKTASP
jgi:hypothetical protein